MDNPKYYEDAIATLNLDDESLYIDLGKELHNNNIIPPTTKRLITTAKKWLQLNLEHLQDKICFDKRVKSNVESETPIMIAVIADIIAARWGFTNPVSAAALIARVGVTKFCQTKW